ncbi:U3 small nucleolar RNA-interacting protein 2-like [Odontomachus brunneus]|uniref:U3 small nucleolar RNA-interacting protein 2-like n=1 Tax=Odontomachus brunneus TaxID=486640 RepID=UPI0013F1FC00|nr:U3 small nucleolar RNA-interacting protein 2-like [Odontomachus brunneus]XP_032685546.1 U3 small nucleolar RNA-interacting protein 2-like [Odontomachus brunneus]
MSFFIRNNRGDGRVKRKFNGAQSISKQSKKFAKKPISDDDESIASTDEEFAEENFKSKTERFVSESEEEEETAQEKRIRLAKKYIKEIEEEEKDRAEFEEGAVSQRLHKEYLEEKGRLRKTVAICYIGHKDLISLKCKEHKTSITCICLLSDGSVLYSGAKDGSIVKWSLKTHSKLIALKGKKVKTEVTLSHYIQCLAISTDGKFLVVGDRDCNDIKVLCGNTLKHIKNLQGHRGSVSGLVFRKNTHTLYSASTDRSIKVWNLDDMAYVESFFGHQGGITSIDALSRERAVTSGFDSSIRIWKIVEESQLIFNGHSNNSIDEVKLINEENFFSCGSDGQLCVWSSLKKKPLCTVTEAHGKDETNNQALWISSIAALLNTDLVASGSRDGSIKLWQCGEAFRSLNPLFEVKIPGFINALAFTPDGNHLIAGVGQEHRNGRWWRVGNVKNCIVVIPLIRNEKT